MSHRADIGQYKIKERDTSEIRHTEIMKLNDFGGNGT